MNRCTSVFHKRVVRWAALLVGAISLVNIELEAAPLPEVDFPTAVGTPGRVWDLPIASGNGLQAFALADPKATDGAVGVLPRLTSIGTRVTGPAIIVLRSDQSLEYAIDGKSEATRYLAGKSGGGYFAFSALVSAGEHEIRFLNLYSSETIKIDRVEIIFPPGSLAEMAGQPSGSITSGGTGWKFVPLLDPGVFAAQSSVTAEAPSWFELPLDGPRKVDFDIVGNGGWKAVSLLVDGVVSGNWGAEGLRNSVQLEVPAGHHVVRFLAKPPEEYGYNSPLEVTISGLRVNTVSAAASLVSALDGGFPVSTSGDWVIASGFPSAGTGTVLQPDFTVASDVSKLLQTGFMGPGYLDFRWYDDGSNGWVGMDGGSYHYSLSYLHGAGPGWRDERIWFPPGPRTVRWLAYGGSSAAARVALDAVHFTPTAVVGIGKALPGVSWENDSQAPWEGAWKGTAGVVLSPEITRGEITRLAASFTGPGNLSFRWNNVGATYGPGEFRLAGKAVAWLGQSQRDEDRQTVTVNIPGSIPVLAEWIAKTEISSREKTRVELDQVKWQPLAEVALPTALNTGKQVTWVTSATHPFTGREDAGAVGGFSAYAALQLDESAWLEAVVDGPGFFDFWIRGLPGMDLSWALWNYWSVTIDGQPVEISGTSWPAQFISGSGKHRVRFTLRNPSGSGRDWLAGAVDDVSWVPLTRVPLNIGSGLSRKTWQTGKSLPAEGFAAAGRTGEPAILLRLGCEESTWVGIDAGGPCELAWDSQLDENAGQNAATLRVDGVDLPLLSPHPWHRTRLTLPTGTHSVRWVAKPQYSEAGIRPAVFASWRLSGVTLKKGVTALADALDVPELFALETGDAGGKRITVGTDDAWKAGEGTSLEFFDPTISRRITTTWGNPDVIPGTWECVSAGRYHILTAEAPGWTLHFSSITPGTTEKWTYPSQDGVFPRPSPPLLKRLVFGASASTPPGLAIGSPLPLDTANWIGISDPLAKEARDSASSLVNVPLVPHPATITLTGPAEVSYWWKRSGTGMFDLALDGAVLPVAPATGEWTNVVFSINPGVHEVSWTHIGTASTSYSTPGEAFLDALKIAPTAAVPLAEAASAGASMDATTSGSHDFPWHPVAYREPSGTWTRAVRAVSGASALSVMVTGPAILEFRGKCFGGAPIPGAAAAATPVRSSVIITLPGDRTQILGHYLFVKVGEANPLRIENAPAGNWTDGAVHVPVGLHEVTFRLQTLKSNLNQFFSDATDETLQGWVGDLKVVSPASRYAAWAASLPPALAGQDADADGDGATNFLEYAFGTDPRDAKSVPPGLEMTVVSNTWTRTRYRAVKLPYLPSHTSGVLQSSTDLSHWENEPVPLLHYPPLYSIFDFNQAPAYPYVAVPPDAAQKFYRIWICDSLPAE